MSSYMEELYGFPNRFINDWKAQGKKVVGVVCCHIPDEILHAAGVLPLRIRATGCEGDPEASMWMSSLSCSFARGMLEQMVDGTLSFMDGVVCSDGCDFIHRVYDNWDYIEKGQKFRYEFCAPRVIHENAYPFYVSEMKYLIEALEKWTGKKVTAEDLANSIKLYNESRVLVNRLYDLRLAKNPVITGEDCLQWTLAAQAMPKEIFNALLSKFLDQASSLPPVPNVKARVVLAGGPIDEPSFIKIIEDKGALVVNDFQCFGRARNIDLVKVKGSSMDDLLNSMAIAYLEQPICPRMVTEHEALTDYCVNLVRESGAQGMVYTYLKNCELWGTELPRFTERLRREGIPLVALEREQFQANAGQVGIRVEAFVEMLEGGRK